MPASRSRSRSKPTPDDRAPGEALRQPAEGLLLLVHHGDGVPAVLEDPGQAGTDPTASDHHDVQGVLLPPTASLPTAGDPTAVLRDLRQHAEVPTSGPLRQPDRRSVRRA